MKPGKRRWIPVWMMMGQAFSSLSHGAADAASTTAFSIGDDVKSELKIVGSILVGYGAKYAEWERVTGPRRARHPDPRYRLSELPLTPEAEFIESRVLGSESSIRLVSDTEFAGVQRTHAACDSDPSLSELPVGMRSHVLACTANGTTWIRRGKWDTLKARQKALVLVHERLHTIEGGVPEEFIADITTSLDWTVTEFKRQQALKPSDIRGRRPRYDSGTLAPIRLLMRRIAQIGLTEGRPDSRFFNRMAMDNDFNIWPNGGGIVLRSSIHPEAFIGIGSIVEDGRIDRGSLLLNSNCTGSSSDHPVQCSIGQDAVVRNVSVISALSSPRQRRPGEGRGRFNQLKVGSGGVLENSRFWNIFDIDVGENARVSNVAFRFALNAPMMSGDEAHEPSRIEFSASSGIYNLPLLMIDSARRQVLGFSANEPIDFGGHQTCPGSEGIWLARSVKITSARSLSEHCR